MKLPLPRLLLAIGLTWLLLAGGCQRDEITAYTAPKDDDEVFFTGGARPATMPRLAGGRILAAIVPHGDNAWFFKLSGPVEAVGEHVQSFTSFVQTVQFGENGEPAWQRPAGWDESRDNPQRFATITVPSGGKRLELSVTALTRVDDDYAAYVLMNVNRWLEQVGENPIDAGQLASMVRQVPLEDGLAASIVDVKGQGGGGAAAGASSPAGAAPQQRVVSFTKPDGWSEGQLTAMRKAAFVVQDGEQRIDVTVIDLVADVNALLPNVNRWRGEVGLPDIAEAELPGAVQKIEVDGKEAAYMELVGPSDSPRPLAILGVIQYRGGKAWFVKLKGDSALAQRERSNFQSFIRSLKFSQN
ncbi:MAG: hypothetical protein HYS13_11295 [Planctomycetia bacterium]|nr:hypothetical protein [Planctomycetia bacterium]